MSHKFLIYITIIYYPDMNRGSCPPPRRKVIIKNFNLNPNSINTYWKLANEKKMDIINIFS